MGNVVLELDGVSKRYGDFLAVDRVSFSAPKGQIVGLLGPNGAGKTSTLRMILGISPPSEGRISIFGKQPGRAVQSRIGYLPEERGLYKRMTAFDTIVYFAKLKGLWGRRARRRANELLAEFGLKALRSAKQLVDSYFSGTRARALFAGESSSQASTSSFSISLCSSAKSGSPT